MIRTGLWWSRGLVVKSMDFQALDPGSTLGWRALWVIFLPNDLSFCSKVIFLLFGRQPFLLLGRQPARPPRRTKSRLEHAPIPRAAPSKTDVPPKEMALNNRRFGPSLSGLATEEKNVTCEQKDQSFGKKITHSARPPRIGSNAWKSILLTSRPRDHNEHNPYWSCHQTEKKLLIHEEKNDRKILTGPPQGKKARVFRNFLVSTTIVFEAFLPNGILLYLERRQIWSPKCFKFDFGKLHLHKLVNRLWWYGVVLWASKGFSNPLIATC